MKENLRQNKVTKTNIINGTASRLLIITALLCISFIYSNIKPPAANAAPTGIIKSSEIRPGMRGYGLSVFNGNRIERFPIVVLGRLKNAIGESDMILIKVLGGYPVSHHTGIIAGMSGSPIYIDGRLAGAIGYGWSFSQEPIGGVTPIEHMLGTFPKYQTKALTHKNPDNREYTIEEPVFVGNDKYDRFIIQDIVNQENKSKPGTMVLSPVPSVLQVHGFGKKSLELIRKEFEPYGIMPVSIPGGYKSAYTGQVPHIQPGSPIGVTLVEGDLSIAGTGTVTYRNGDEILAFGHPMLQLGKTDLPLNAARIEAIIPSMNVPFKLSSSLGVVGTLTQDRLYAIAGSLHKKPDMIPMSVAVHDQARNWKKTFNVKMAKQPYFTPLIVSIVGAESLSSSSTNFAGSSGKVEYNLKFKNYPAIKFEDYIAGDFIQSDLYMQVMQYMRYLMTNEFDVPVLEKASMKITVFPDNRTARIQDVSTQYPQVRPGDSIEVAIRLRTLQGENIVKKVKVPIPADLKKGNVKIGVASGRMIRQLNRKMRYSRLTPTNVNQLLNMIRFDTRNNELAVQVMYPKRSIGYAGEKFSNLPGAIISAFASSPRSSVMVMADHYETRVPLDYNIEGIGVIQVGLSNDVPSSPDSASFEGVETEEVTPDDDPAMEEINKPDLLALRSEIINEYGNVDTIMVAKNKKILHKDIKKNLPTGSFMASIASAHDYFLGNFNRTSITNGNITLAHKMDYPFMSSQPFIMSMIYDSDKNRIVFAESPSGLIMELLDGEAPGVLGRTEEVFLPVMTRDNQGNIYIGTGPNGNIYKYSPDGKFGLFTTLDDNIIWDIKVEESGNLLACTGNMGRLYRITPEGKAEKLFEIQDTHMTAIEILPDGSILLGCSNKGAIYKMDPSGATEIYYSTIEPSITDLLYENGNLWIASDRLLYKLSENKLPKIFIFPEESILKVKQDQQGNILAGTSNLGRIYKISQDGSCENLFESEMNQVMAIALSPSNELYLATGNPGNVVKVENDYNDEGYFLSEVFDTQRYSHFGRIQWQADIPEGTELTLQTRTGNTPDPNDTWSDWSPTYSMNQGQKTMNPAARYIQIKANFKTTNPAKTPRLFDIAVYYKHNNTAPVITVASPKGGEKWSGIEEIKWKGLVANPQSLSYSLFYSEDGEKWKPIKQNINASLKTDFKQGKTPEESYKWNTNIVEDGSYMLKIVGFDRTDPDNPNLRTEVKTKPIIITNKSPEITIISSKGTKKQARLIGFVKTYLANLKEVKYKINNDDWAMAIPRDGIFDNTRERFNIYLNQPYPKRFKLTIHATDEAGNEEETTQNISISIEKDQEEKDKEKDGQNNEEKQNDE